METIKQVRVIEVLKNMIELSKNEESFAELFSEMLEKDLEDFAIDDIFGTERQLDPRGDGRNGEFSMDCVEGVDD